VRILRHPVVAAAAAFVLLVTAVRPATAATTLAWYDANGNGRADTWLVDDNGDGVTDRMIVDGNENNWGEAQVFYQGGYAIWSTLDGNEDGLNEMAMQPTYWSNGTLRGRTMWSDQDRNGRWENGYHDGNLDGIYESVCIDTNFDGQADTWTGSSAPAGGGAIANMMARNVAFTNWVNDMHGRGLSVFFPTVSVPLP
jgi:hypothetical protein